MSETRMTPKRQGVPSRRKMLSLLAATAASLSPGLSVAQESYPTKPITIVVGFAPGGITDIFARELGLHASRILNQPVIIDNKPGAAGLLGSDLAARATPDGYTLLMTANNHTINPALRPKLRFDASKDFTAITLIASTPNILIVPAASRFANVQGYVAAAKEKPDAVSYATSGVGTAPHLTGEYFGSISAANFLHVPYKGSNQSIMAVLSGEVDSAWSAASLQQIKSGKVRALGVASDKRFALAPEIPTFAEQGFKNFEAEVWVGLLGPAKLPGQIAERWNTLMQQLLAREDIQEKFKVQGYLPIRNVGLSDFQQRIVREVGVYTKVASQANITAE